MRKHESAVRSRELSSDIHRLLIESVQDHAIFALDPRGYVVTWNTGAERIKGYSANDIVGQHFSVFYTEEAKAARKPDLELESAAQVGRVEDEGWRLRKDGSRVWANIIVTALRDASGQLMGFGVVTRDLTARRATEDTEHQLLLDAASTALSSSLDYNEMLSKLASLLVPGLAEWCAINLIEGDQLENVAIAHVDRSKIAMAREYQRKYALDSRTRRGLWSVLEEGHSELYETISDDTLIKRAQDEEHLRYLRALEMRSVIIVPILVRDRAVGTLSLISTRAGRRYDKSDLALVEELGRRAGVSIENAKLYAAEKSAARRAEDAAKRAEDAGRIKDEFLATVSHELRTPLNAIVGWAYILRERNRDEALAKGIDVIHRNAQAQAKIIEDILDVSRIITGNLRLDLKSSDVLVTIRNAIEVVSASANAKQITIDFTPPVGVCVVTADHERLQQVVWNLLSNAVKFTGSGGRIALSLRCSPVFVSLAVSDTGTGIDALFLPYVFDRFKQADSSTTRRVGGLGLGLAIVRHIVELHGGRVVVDSAGLGRGATFTVTLPVSVPQNAAHTRALAPPAIADPQINVSPSSLQGVRVLIVDDEADTRELLHTVLTSAGATVDCAATAATAFDVLQSFHPHVLVSDVGMPDEDGYAFMERVRGLPPSRSGNVPSIALTAYTRSTDRSKALAAGFSAHLAKPVNVADLVGTVAKLAFG